MNSAIRQSALVNPPRARVHQKAPCALQRQLLCKETLVKVDETVMSTQYTAADVNGHGSPQRIVPNPTHHCNGRQRGQS